MSHIKRYIEKSILIPPHIKESMATEEVHQAMKEEMLSFMETYIPLEKAILHQVNKELETLNLQIRNFLTSKEAKLRDQEMKEMEYEIAYL